MSFLLWTFMKSLWSFVVSLWPLGIHIISLVQKIFGLAARWPSSRWPRRWTVLSPQEGCGWLAGTGRIWWPLWLQPGLWPGRRRWRMTRVIWTGRSLISTGRTKTAPVRSIVATTVPMTVRSIVAPATVRSIVAPATVRSIVAPATVAPMTAPAATTARTAATTVRSIVAPALPSCQKDCEKEYERDNNVLKHVLKMILKRYWNDMKRCIKN